VSVRRKGEKYWKFGRKNSLFKEISPKERYAVKEHHNIGSNHQQSKTIK
jgi:hypothetical protein